MAAVALGAAVCSCSTDILDQPEFNGSEMMVEASGFDGKDAASYISWIKISRQGDRRTDLSDGTEVCGRPRYASSGN